MNTTHVTHGPRSGWTVTTGNISTAFRNEEAAAVQIGLLQQEIERLRAIVDRLPKTADGVPMVPGLRVWIWFGGKITEAVHSGTDPKQSYWGNALWCYSTKEAAEEAERRMGV